MKLHDTSRPAITQREWVIDKLAHVNIESICMYCNGVRYGGCVNADDKPVPCLCDGPCDHDQECVCECHQWQRLTRFARKFLVATERKLGTANEY